MLIAMFDNKYCIGYLSPPNIRALTLPVHGSVSALFRPAQSRGARDGRRVRDLPNRWPDLDSHLTQPRHRPANSTISHSFYFNIWFVLGPRRYPQHILETDCGYAQRQWQQQHSLLCTRLSNLTYPYPYHYHSSLCHVIFTSARIAM